MFTPTLAASLFNTDLDTLLSAAAYFAGSVFFILAGWWLRDRIAIIGGQSITRLITDRNNAPVAIEAGSFLVAMVIGVLGSVLLPDGTAIERALDFIATSAIVLGALLLTDQLAIRLLLPGIAANHATSVDHNLAVAIVRSASHIAAAFVIRAALHHDSPLWERLVWVLIGQAALVLLVRLYQAFTPWDDVGELRHKNVAAALPMAGLLVGTGLIVAAAVAGEGAGWGEDLMSFGVDIVVSVALFLGVRTFADRVLIRGSTFATEIVRDKNAGAGFIEGAAYLAMAIGIAFFLN